MKASRKTSFQLVILIFLPFFSQFMLLEATIFNFISNATNFNVGCTKMERKALLEFKGGLKDPSNRLSSWVGHDCCNWMGVTCSHRTGNVVKLDLQGPPTECDWFSRSSCLGGELNSSLIGLKYLKYLDLSQNDFQGMPIPSFIGSLKKLRHLNLSHASFAGIVPTHLGNLLNLRHLDLSFNDFQGMPIPNFVGSLKKLRHLDLSHASFVGIVPPHLGNLSNLHHLDLSDYFDNSPHLKVADSNWISGLSSIEYLNLGGVNLSKATTNWLQAITVLPCLSKLLLPDCQLHFFPDRSLPVVNFTSLLVLDLSYNNFSSGIPQWVFNITTLMELSLTDCEITGSIPKIERGNVCKLQKLSLSSNYLSGEIIDSLGSTLFGCSNSSLEWLDLKDNQLSGHLPKSLVRLQNLKHLDLSVNSFSGSLPTSIGLLSSLENLILDFNKMSGTIPDTVGQLTELVYLSLVGNYCEGVIFEIHFLGLSKLKYFRISSSNKSLVFNISQDWIPSFSLDGISIVNCKLGPTFPYWLQTQNELALVQLVRAAISDKIPDWVWKLFPQLEYLSLSGNQLHGKLPNSISFVFEASVDLSFNSLEGSLPLWYNVGALFLRNNFFLGPIPLNISSSSPRLTVLDLVGNLLNGSIPNSMIKLKELHALMLSDNHLSGRIPTHWKALQYLEAIDLSNNNLSGNIPSSMCSLPRLRFLRLSNNHLFGELSPPLKKCKLLQTLDLGENRFSGNIPKWIGESLLSLTQLILRGNMLTGLITGRLCGLPNLHILDLAHNRLSGSIPQCLGNLRRMSNSTPYFPPLLNISTKYGMEIKLVMKGRLDNYTEQMLPLVNTIDLSCNNLWGEIPKEITNLWALVTLNLSQNQLTGKIPEKIEELQRLETLDLSCNHLSGPIPPSMASMTFLSHLNVSHNNLSGPIPSSNQFSTFNDPSIYEGNTGLCGPPVSTNCSTPKYPTLAKDNNKVENGYEIPCFYISMALGFIVGFWAVCCTLIMKKSWRYAYFRFLDDMKDKLFVVISVNVARLRRKLKLERN